MEKKTKLNRWLAGTIITLSIIAAVILTILLGEDLASLNIFIPAEKKSDFRITDIYNAVEINNLEKAGILEYDDNVVVVAIDGLNREQTIDVINQVAQLQPAAIGLDFDFKDSLLHRDYLLNTILFNSHIVSATKVRPINDEGTTYQREFLSFYEKEYPSVQVGYVNLDAKNTWDIIRTFHAFVQDEDGDTLPSMTLQLAKLANLHRAQQLMEHGKAPVNIDFVSHNIRIIPTGQLVDSSTVDLIRGKVVLIGDIALATDMYMTPLHEPMAGVLIHAYALQTVLNASYIDIYPKLRIWILALAIGILFVFVLQLAKVLLSNTGNITIRILQFLGIFCFVWIGCKEFSTEHKYVDYTSVIFILGFSTLVFDILYGLIGFVTWFPQLPDKLRVLPQKIRILYLYLPFMVKIQCSRIRNKINKKNKR